MRKGKVFLVGAGPGDPGLITVKGLESLANADAVIYDRLVDERLLATARADAELIYVGKAAKRHTLSQEDINALIVAKAKEGKTVVRLKGGDPFVFGRGGEEAETLVSEGIPFEVVPGVSAATAVPAYAGIPVTHRNLTASFAVITGHEDPAKLESKLAWDKLATGIGTIIFLMGVGNLSTIVAELVKHGRSEATPTALIRRGTTPQQETLVGTLSDIVEKVKEADFKPPAVLVVGKVVGLRDKLRWFDSKSLFGKRILVTRSRKQASHLSRLLSAEGAEPIELPTIQIESPSDYAPFDHALANLSRYSWIVFTSVNGVEAFFGRLEERGLDSRALKGVKLCAIGSATAGALVRYGLRADLVPEDYSSEGLLADLKRRRIAGNRFLLPRAENVPEELARGLTDLGAEVEEVVTYQTVPPHEMNAPAREMLLAGEIDIVTFTSSSTVRNLVAILEDKVDILKRATVACIGPVTAKTAAELGLRVDLVAREHTIPGLVAALKEEYHGAEGAS